jgi:hypothetical protein
MHVYDMAFPKTHGGQVFCRTPRQVLLFRVESGRVINFIAVCPVNSANPLLPWRTAEDCNY